MGRGWGRINSCFGVGPPTSVQGHPWSWNIRLSESEPTIGSLIGVFTSIVGVRGD